MSEFHDPDLRQQLGRLSGPYPDDNVAFAAWQRRVGYARRRRVVAWTTGAAMSLIIATVAVAAVQSPGRHTLVPSAENSEITDAVDGTEADDSSTTEITAPETSELTTLAPETTPSSEVVETSMPEVETTAPAGEQPSNGSPSKGGSPSNPASTSATRVFHSVGGSITVRQDGDQLTIIAASPSAGFHTGDISRPNKRVDVTFKSANHQSEISVKLVNGVMKESVAEDNEGHDTTVPDSGGGGGDGGDGQGGGG